MPPLVTIKDAFGRGNHTWQNVQTIMSFAANSTVLRPLFQGYILFQGFVIYCTIDLEYYLCYVNAQKIVGFWISFWLWRWSKEFPEPGYDLVQKCTKSISKLYPIPGYQWLQPVGMVVANLAYDSNTTNINILNWAAYHRTVVWCILCHLVGGLCFNSSKIFLIYVGRSSRGWWLVGWHANLDIVPMRMQTRPLIPTQLCRRFHRGARIRRLLAVL